jgi:hypothetical protein
MIQLNWYKIFGVQIPDGSTVLPTDDIQIWLHCANIWDKNYTTLAEVLADSTTLSALISSNNAVDYMVRSTTWAVSVSVPTMTSNTTPSGECFGESLLSGSNYYGAFDKVINDTSNAYKFVSNGHKPSYVGYRFTQPVNVCRFEITPSARDIPTKFTLQGSNNGSDWIDIQTYVDSTMSGLITKSFDVVNSSSCEYYRLYVLETSEPSRPYVQIVELQFYSASITDSATAMSYIGLNNYCANTLLADSTWKTAICNSAYFESVLNVKVPVMTSNTTPSGVCYGSAFYESTPAYMAFDGNTGTQARIGITTNTYCAYRFSSSKKIYCAIVQGICANSHLDYKSSDWVIWKSFTAPYDTPILVIPDNPATATDFRVYCTSSGHGSVTWYTEIQFYGREDV